MVPKSNTMMLKDHLHQDDEPSCTAGSSTLGHLPTPVAPIRRKRFVTIFATFIVLIGAAATVSFLYIWITSAKEDEQERFDRRASAVIQEIEAAWEDYEYAALWTHGACRRQNFTRGDFRELYLYLRSGGLQFQAVEFVPNVTRDERAQVEEEDRDFYRAHYPGIEYYGFKGVEEDPEGGVSIQNRSIQPFYFPIRYVEPVETNAAAIGFDLYSSANTKTAIEHALKTWKPTLTTRIQLLQEEDPSSFSVLLMHPGVSLEEIDPNIKPRDLSLLVIRMPALLERASRHETESVGMYLYDKTVSPPQFLGGISMRVHEDNGKMIREVELFPEIELDELLASKDSEAVDILRQEISALSTTWEIVVIPVNDAYESDLAFVWFAGAVIFCASVSMALCLFLKMRSATVMDQIISDAEADKAIVSSLFPSAIRRRLEADFKANHDRPRLLDGNADHCTSTYIFGSAPIAGKPVPPQ